MAILQMSEGQKCEVWIPSRLAYGCDPPFEQVPPNSDLLFHLKIHKIGQTLLERDFIPIKLSGLNPANVQLANQLEMNNQTNLNLDDVDLGLKYTFFFLFFDFTQS